MRIAATFILCLFLGAVEAQTKSELPENVEQLRELRQQVISSNDRDEIQAYNKRFKNSLKEALLLPQTIDRYADSIPSFGVIKSPDKAFTIYNWNLVNEFEEYTYFGFIRLKDGSIIELMDESSNMNEPLKKVNQTNNWYGALYYEIIPTKVKKDVYYVLLGWDGKSKFSTRKVIDVFYYDEKLNNWFFGKKIFGPPFRDQTRYFIEYSSKVVISLKYHPKKSQIIFDHVVPPNDGLKGIYDFYVPDMSFDAFEFRKDAWYFIQNVDVRGEQTMENYVDPNKNQRPR